MHVLAEIEPLDPVTGLRPLLRVSSTGRNRDAAAHDGEAWWPAIRRKPQMRLQLFDGDFTSDVSVAGGNVVLSRSVLAEFDPLAPRYVWAGAKVRLVKWRGPADAEPLFTGTVKRFSSQDDTLTLVMDVDTEPFDVDVLAASYAGTTGLEGGSEIKGRAKPWIFGRARNVEPVLIDDINNVYQFSAYGSIEGVLGMYERGSSFGSPQADYGTYAELVAAYVPEGAWATCHAQGLVRMGAPPYGVLTGDVDGDNVGGTFWRKTGDIIARIVDELGIDPTLINAASLAALDAAVPYNVNVAIYDQSSVLALAQRLARPCNAVAGLDWLGRLFVSRIAFDTPSLALDAQGRQMPPVMAVREETVSPPYKRVVLGAQRSWRVHTLDEIAYYAPLIDMGEYDPTTVYREGNIVSYGGGQWLYINAVPSSGNTPVSGSAYWSIMYGISTYRYPELPPANPAIGSIYWDADNHPYRFEGRQLHFDDDPLAFNGDPLEGPGWVSVRDRGLINLINDIQALDDDGMMTVVEKKIAINLNRSLEAIYSGILLQAASLNLGTASFIVALTAARAAYIEARDSLVPAWDDLSAPSSFNGINWDGILDTYEAAIAYAQARLANAANVWVLPPANVAVRVTSIGVPAAGQYPMTLTPTVKRGDVDIRIENDVTYALGTPTGDVSATINNTAGNANKGRITVTAGTNGTLPLTVTVDGVPYAFVILFTSVAQDDFGFVSGKGYYERRNKLTGHVVLEQWGTVSVAANALTTISFPLPFANTDYGIVSGGADPQSTNDQDNYPELKLTTKTTTTVEVWNSDDTATSFCWRAIGIE